MSSTYVYSRRLNPRIGERRRSSVAHAGGPALPMRCQRHVSRHLPWMVVFIRAGKWFLILLDGRRDVGDCALWDSTQLKNWPTAQYAGMPYCFADTKAIAPPLNALGGPRMILWSEILSLISIRAILHFDRAASGELCLCYCFKPTLAACYQIRLYDVYLKARMT